MVLFAVFLVWFPVWITWPRSLIGRILTAVFTITFGVIGLELRVFDRLVDKYIARRGWQLR
jgi:hypothetical protein